MYQAYKTTPSRLKLWISKWLSGWMPIGSKLKQWKLSTTDVCPRCGDPEKHHHHVLWCTQDEATHQWAATPLTKLDRWLLRNHKQSNLHAGILDGLRAWHDQRLTCTVTSNWPGVEKTLEEQATAGWDKLSMAFW
jgi:hypothetical protein